MAKIIAFAVVCFLHFVLTDCRQGWKTYGNGYFGYETKTDFQTSKELKISGKFSSLQNSSTKNTILSVYDSNEQFTFQIMLEKGIFHTAYKPTSGSPSEEQTWNPTGIIQGYAYDFTVTVAGNNKSASGLECTVKTDISGISGAGFKAGPWNVTWNFTSIKIKIGGNSPDPVRGNFFEGCLSNITYKGVDIIGTYFTQYPNNTNPIRGKETFVKNGKGFSNVSQACDDVIPTTGPTTTHPQTTHSTTKISSSSAVGTKTPTATPKKNMTSPTTQPSYGNANQFSFMALFSCILLTMFWHTY